MLSNKSTASFIEDIYPKIKLFPYAGDFGEPLFLTKYIESGDIENVSKTTSNFFLNVFVVANDLCLPRIVECSASNEK